MPLLYLIAQPLAQMHRGPGPYGGWDGGWGIAHVVFMLLIAALVVLAIVWLVRNLGAGPGRHQGGPTAQELLDRRFAEGTISVEEYTERRRHLTGGPAGG